MTATVITSGSIHELVERLGSAVSRTKRADPLAPIQVVTGSHLQHIHLRRSLAGALGAVAIRLSGAVLRAVAADGVNLFLADGAAAGQEVFHMHLHIIPRFRGDAFKLRMPPRYPTETDRGRLDDLAASVRAELA